MSWTDNIKKLARCLNSASVNFKNRSMTSLGALQDVESDLEGALKAVKELIAITLKEREV